MLKRSVYLAVLVFMHLAFVAGPEVVKEAVNTHRVLQETVETWRARRVYVIPLASLKEFLASKWWLGAYRPMPVPDPLLNCRLDSGGSVTWWEALIRLPQNRRRLKCMQEGILAFRESHYEFWIRIQAMLFFAGVFFLWIMRHPRLLKILQPIMWYKNLQHRHYSTQDWCSEPSSQSTSEPSTNGSPSQTTDSSSTTDGASGLNRGASSSPDSNKSTQLSKDSRTGSCSEEELFQAVHTIVLWYVQRVKWNSRNQSPKDTSDESLSSTESNNTLSENNSEASSNDSSSGVQGYIK